MIWPNVRLGDHVSILGGGTPSRTDASNWNGQIRWASVKDLGSFEISGTRESITETGLRTSATRLVPKGTVVIASRVGLGKVAIAQIDLAINQDLKALVPGPSLHNRYLAYFLLSQAPAIRRMGAGATVKGVTTDQIADLRMPLPPLHHQQRIVAILDRAGALRCKRADADHLATRVLPALFLKMFGDPISNPLGWPTDQMGNLGHLERGRSQHRPRNDPRLLGGPYPFVQTGDIVSAIGVLRTFRATYSELGLAQSRLWPAGTLCITIAANIAATAILGFPACFPDSIVGFTPGPATDVSFVSTVLGLMRPRLEAQAPQLAQKNINLETLRTLRIPVPPAEQLRQFRHFHYGMLTVQEAGSASRDSLNALWTNLLNRAFIRRSAGQDQA